MEAEEKRGYEHTDAEASMTFAAQAGHVRKGDYIMIRDRPCKVVEVNACKTGKHGGTKSHFIGKDCFTDDKLEAIYVTKANVDVPVIAKDEYQVVPTWYESCTIKGGNHCTLLDLKTCETRSDLKVPEPIAIRVCEIFEAHRQKDVDVAVVVFKACGREKIIDVKLMGAAG